MVYATGNTEAIALMQKRGGLNFERCSLQFYLRLSSTNIKASNALQTVLLRTGIDNSRCADRER